MNTAKTNATPSNTNTPPGVVGTKSLLLEAILDAESHIKEIKEWKTEELNVTFATSLDDDTPMVKNIIETFTGKDVRETQNKMIHSEPYWFPAEYNQNNANFSSQVLLGHLNCAALAQGFELRIKSWYSTGRLAIHCRRAEQYKSKTRRGNSQIRSN